jgi:hypothetical protein
LKVLVACEFSGVVRDAFEKRGHDAWSCDLLPSEKPGKHIQDDVLNHMDEDWELIIAHPPCTHLAVSGARWFKGKEKEQQAAISFFMEFVQAHYEYNKPKVAIENPVSVISTYWDKPTQIIQPWQFGHGETKKTCLWLLGLPPLTPTKVVDGREARVHKEPPSPNRWKNRSRTFPGIAAAMAEQWGG